MKIALVEWVDSCAYNGWHTYTPNGDTFSYCITLGVVIRDDGEQITLYPSKNDSGRCTDTMSIPKGCVKRIRYLRVWKTKN